MLVKSNSVPNFLFEEPQKKQYKLRLLNLPKLVSYGEFLKTNPKATKEERREAIRTFYEMLLRK